VLKVRQLVAIFSMHVKVKGKKKIERCAFEKHSTRYDEITTTTDDVVKRNRRRRRRRKRR
jgi:hypothetical protein